MVATNCRVQNSLDGGNFEQLSNKVYELVGNLGSMKCHNSQRELCLPSYFYLRRISYISSIGATLSVWSTRGGNRRSCGEKFKEEEKSKLAPRMTTFQNVAISSFFGGHENPVQRDD